MNNRAYAAIVLLLVVSTAIFLATADLQASASGIDVARANGSPVIQPALSKVMPLDSQSAAQLSQPTRNARGIESGGTHSALRDTQQQMVLRRRRGISLLVTLVIVFLLLRRPSAESPYVGGLYSE